VGVVRECRNFEGVHGAHCAVIFAIAQLSCYLNSRIDKPLNTGTSRSNSHFKMLRQYNVVTEKLMRYLSYFILREVIFLKGWRPLTVQVPFVSLSVPTVRP